MWYIIFVILSVQDETIEKFQQEKEKSIFEFKEEFESFKKLRKEQKHLQNILTEERCKLKKNVGKVVNYKKELMVINVGRESFFENIIKLNMDLINVR